MKHRRCKRHIYTQGDKNTKLWVNNVACVRPLGLTDLRTVEPCAQYRHHTPIEEQPNFPGYIRAANTSLSLQKWADMAQVCCHECWTELDIEDEMDGMGYANDIHIGWTRFCGLECMRAHHARVSDMAECYTCGSKGREHLDCSYETCLRSGCSECLDTTTYEGPICPACAMVVEASIQFLTQYGFTIFPRK
jgi:hypothetical protein